MPLDFSPDVMINLVQYLWPFEAQWLTFASPSTMRASESASSFLCSSMFKGMELFRRRPLKGALFQQLRELVRPQLLLTLHRCPSACRANYTLPMNIAFDTSGQIFVLFRVYHHNTGHATNGPSVGVVDLVDARNRPIKLSHDDWSRPHRPSDLFAISCNPFTCKIHASDTPAEGLEHIPENEPSPPKSWSAEILGWEPLGASNGSSVDVGMLIRNGTLQFVRTGPCGYEASGIVWDRLPPKIVCCAFLSDFGGMASVFIQKVCWCGLERFNLEEDCHMCGELSPWAPWPVAK